MKSNNFVQRISPEALMGLKDINSSKVIVSSQSLKNEKTGAKDDLYKCMRYFLIFGKCIGVVPISGVFNSNLQKVRFRRFSFTGITTALIILLLTCNTGLAIAGFFRDGGRDATELAKNAAGSVCYSMGLYVFVFIYQNSQNFIDLLNKWRTTQFSFSKEDTKLALSINLIAGLILTSAVSENAVSHLLLFPRIDNGTDRLKFYYEKSHSQWASMIPYNPVIAIIVFLCNKWAVYAWNFGDIFISVCSRAIYGKFKGFIEVAEEKLQNSKSKSNSEWIEAINDHDNLCELQKGFAAMLSPLIFTSFSVNIYFTCIQLHLFLAPSKSSDFVSSLYSGWSFLHLVLRMYVVSLTSAKINDYAHQFGKLLYKCPREAYSFEVERAERKLSTNQIAMDGLGTFYIGRPFILSVISVIFTFEIVLLQATPMSLYEAFIKMKDSKE